MSDLEDEVDESGEYEVFDGSQDEGSPVGPSMLLHEMFFDQEGNAVTLEDHKRMCPDGRQEIERTVVLGCVVVTQFVGVNHNTSPIGEPHIFETLVHVDGDVVYSEWSSNRERAGYSHSWAVLRLAFGGAVVWPARVLLRRVRDDLRRKARL